MAPHKSNKKKKTQLLPELAAAEAECEVEERRMTAQLALEEQQRVVDRLRAFREVRLTLTRDVQDMMQANVDARSALEVQQQQQHVPDVERHLPAAPTAKQEATTEAEIASTVSYESDFDDQQDDDVKNGGGESEQKNGRANDDDDSADSQKQVDLVESVLQGMLTHLSEIKQHLQKIDQEHKEIDKLEEQPRHVDPTFAADAADHDDAAAELLMSAQQQETRPSFVELPRLGFGMTAVRFIDKNNKVQKNEVVEQEEKSDEGVVQCCDDVADESEVVVD